MRPLGLLVGAALLLAACNGNRSEPLLISEINVDTDLSAVGTREAVDYWQGLDSDLEAAIAGQVVGRSDPLGKRIRVDIDEISLSSAFSPGANAETARLSGRVVLENPDGTQAAAYDVAATSQDVVNYLQPGSNVVSISPTSREYYNAIVEAFARGTAQVLSGAS
jgi:hypothetical protein